MASTANESIKVAEESGICGDNVQDNLEPRFECPICLTWLRDPVLTSCGHKFCSQCIYKWLQKDGAFCPIDNQPLKSESDLFRDLYTSREISQRRTYCPNHQFGCLVELSPIDMESHINNCSYKQDTPNSKGLACPFKKLNCQETFGSEELLHKHVETNFNSHLMMIVHALPGASFSREDNSIATESQLWDPPAKCETTDPSKEEPPPEWQQLLKNLYERIVILEQENRELSIIVSNQKNQITSLQTSVRYNQEEILLLNCNGIYVWRLNSFRDKLTLMTNDPLKMFYSPGFYTNPNGYKICARVNISSKDPEFLSLLLHIMKSDNDDALDWPFHGTMYFVLVHPNNSEQDIREVTLSKPDLEAFRKPICELNKRSFGYTEFVRISDLSEFLQNDCLIFRIGVKPHDNFKTFAI